MDRDGVKKNYERREGREREREKKRGGRGTEKKPPQHTTQKNYTATPELDDSAHYTDPGAADRHADGGPASPRPTWQHRSQRPVAAGGRCCDPSSALPPLIRRRRPVAAARPAGRVQSNALPADRLASAQHLGNGRLAPISLALIGSKRRHLTVPTNERSSLRVGLHISSPCSFVTQFPSC